MKRSLHCAISLLALSAASPAFAADYPDNFAPLRPSYQQDFGTGEDSLQFEAGVRYWYSKGGQKVSLGEISGETKDTSYILEGHLKVEDSFTNSYLKASGGYAVATEGEYASSLSGDTVEFTGGQIGHVGADFGYMPLGTEKFRLGALVGYQYLRESPDKARADILNIDALNIHALRLGLTAKADITEFLDITAEVAGVPYAWVNGVTPNYVITPGNQGGIFADRMVGDVNGAAYGASGELMLGLHPTENLTIRIGGRGWFLTGPATANVTYSAAADPSTTYVQGTVFEPLSLFRYGALFELTGRF